MNNTFVIESACNISSITVMLMLICEKARYMIGNHHQLASNDSLLLYHWKSLSPRPPPPINIGLSNHHQLASNDSLQLSQHWTSYSRSTPSTPPPPPVTYPRHLSQSCLCQCVRGRARYIMGNHHQLSSNDSLLLYHWKSYSSSSSTPLPPPPVAYPRHPSQSH